MRKRALLTSLVLAVVLGSGPLGEALAAGSHAPLVTPMKIARGDAASGISGGQIIETARRYLGYPYALEGADPSGFSCIGFVSYVYHQLGIPEPGGLDEALAYAPRVPFSQLQTGDVLFFQNTVWPGVSHAAIYIGDGRFIHSEWYGRGVVISTFTHDPVDYDYWAGKYLTANRPLAVALSRPAPPAAPAPRHVSRPAPRPAPKPVRQSLTRPTPVPVVPSAPIHLRTLLSPNTPAVRAAHPVPPATRAAAPRSLMGSTATPALNLRSAPSTDGSVLQVLPAGTSVTVLKQQAGWYRVRTRGQGTGWINAAYASVR